MSIFSSFSNMFNLKSPFSDGMSSSSTDFLKTDNALDALGYNKTPRVTDNLKSFQKDQGLKVDGIMNPGGPTAGALGSSLFDNGIKQDSLLSNPYAMNPPTRPKPKVPKPSPNLLDMGFNKPLPLLKMPKMNPVSPKSQQTLQEMRSMPAVTSNIAAPAVLAAKQNLTLQDLRSMPKAEPTSKPLEAAGPRKGADIDGTINEMNKKWPNSNLRVTGKGRAIKRQAELMADQRVRDAKTFMKTYRNHPHIKEMDKWVKKNPRSPREKIVHEYEKIINRARKDGYKVSNHLSDRARDMSVPKSNQKEIRKYLESRGIKVLNEEGAAGGPHWHLDFD